MEDNSKRTEILEAAKKCFKEKGFYGCSINDIAKTAGITKSLLYYYFKSKEDIYIGLTEESLKRIMKTVPEARKTGLETSFEIIYNGIKEEKDVLVIALLDVLVDDSKTNMLIELAKNCFDSIFANEEVNDETMFLRLMFILRAIDFYAVIDKTESYFDIPFETAEKIHKEDLFRLYKKIYKKGV
ncbi:MAG: TetR/AcrR family transcriptional regulator [Clostridiales bacterium]|nr:TetR/AcrR family transcriptional regulator [Clostridiales bacterium]